MNRTFLTLLTLLIGLTAFGQKVEITGTVTSAEDGEPLIGVTVRDKTGNTEMAY